MVPNSAASRSSRSANSLDTAQLSNSRFDTRSSAITTTPGNTNSSHEKSEVSEPEPIGAGGGWDNHGAIAALSGGGGGGSRSPPNLSSFSPADDHHQSQSYSDGGAAAGGWALNNISYNASHLNGGPTSYYKKGFNNNNSWTKSSKGYNTGCTSWTNNIYKGTHNNPELYNATTSGGKSSSTKGLNKYGLGGGGFSKDTTNTTSISTSKYNYGEKKSHFYGTTTSAEHAASIATSSYINNPPPSSSHIISNSSTQQHQWTTTNNIRQPTPTELYDSGMERTLDGGRMDPRKNTPPHLLYNKLHEKDRERHLFFQEAEDNNNKENVFNTNNKNDSDALSVYSEDGGPLMMDPSKAVNNNNNNNASSGDHNTTTTTTTKDAHNRAVLGEVCNKLALNNDRGSSYTTQQDLDQFSPSAERWTSHSSQAQREANKIWYHNSMRCANDNQEEMGVQDTLRSSETRLAQLPKACGWAQDITQNFKKWEKLKEEIAKVEASGNGSKEKLDLLQEKLAAGSSCLVTTVMIRNIPNRYSTEEVLGEIDARGIYYIMCEVYNIIT